MWKPSSWNKLFATKATKKIEVKEQWDTSFGILSDPFTDADTQLLPPVSARLWVNRYHRMIEGETVTRAFATAVQLLMSQVSFRIECNDNDTNNETEALANELLFDWVSEDFQQFVKAYVSTFLYGYSVFEVVLRRSPKGYALDGLVYHPQAFLTAQFEDGHLKGFQTTQSTEVLPMGRLLYSQGLGGFSGGVYGSSVLKAAYYHYVNKCRLLTDEAMNVRNNVSGIPKVRFDDSGTPEENRKRKEAVAQEMQRFRKRALNAFVFGSKPHANQNGDPTGMHKQDIELISVQGSKSIDVNTIIQREETAIARALLADFLVMVGADSGSYAMAKDKSSMFKLLVEGICSQLCHEFNHQLVKPLWLLNGQDKAYMPKLTYDSVDLSLDGMATYISALTSAGVLLNDPDTEAYLRAYGGLPEVSHEDV